MATLLVIAVGPYVVHDYSHAMLMYIAIANCLCMQFTTIAARAFQAFEQMRFTAVLNLLTNCLRMMAAAVMLLTLHHATAEEWAFAALIVSVIAVVVAVAVTNQRFGRPEYDLRLMYQRAGEGLVFAITYSTSGILNDIDKVMLGHYGMNVANGIYSMAYKAIDVCTMPIISIQTAAIPRFFKKGEAAGITSTAAYAARIIKRTAPMGILMAAVMFVAAPIIPVVAGHGFAESVTALRWLALLPFFRSFHMSAGDALSGAGHQKLRLAMQVVAAAFNFGANLYLIPRYGWLGAAWSSLATDGMLGALNWTVLLSRIGPTKKPQQVKA
jgi:O-antigen/teichoic acid export membrane protein